tara:strand:+ start:819 stop:1889 length:1071 start_codon:yes stop_codon:yes gene_type:complete
MDVVKIGKSKIGLNYPTYFVADIAANHDGDLSRAIDLIYKCADSGANAAKFQNFKAETIVSDYGFKSLNSKKSHQSNWKKSIYEVYDEASISLEWTSKLKAACSDAGIDYFTAPYDISLIDELDKFVAAWKIGSGDITWLELIENLSKRGKTVLIATGASSFEDVEKAMNILKKNTNKIVLMQCNTNYTASLENFKYVNLSVLKNYANIFPEAILGLSDHTPYHSTTLGAITLGARVIEKHFTDDIEREGPDHKFSMDPITWREMVDRSRELEFSLGDGRKKVELNEKETVILQRRALRASRNIKKGTILTKEDISALRPCPKDGLSPEHVQNIQGKKANSDILKGQLINSSNLHL